jgi:hypothetical protein
VCFGIRSRSSVEEHEAGPIRASRLLSERRWPPAIVIKTTFWKLPLKKLIICTAVLGLAFSSAAQAKGCIKAAIVGGGRGFGRGSRQGRRCCWLCDRSSRSQQGGRGKCQSTGSDLSLKRRRQKLVVSERRLGRAPVFVLKGRPARSPKSAQY